MLGTVIKDYGYFKTGEVVEVVNYGEFGVLGNVWEVRTQLTETTWKVSYINKHCVEWR